MVGRLKICGIGYVFNYCGRTVEDTDKRMTRFDSGRKIGLEKVLIDF